MHQYLYQRLRDALNRVPITATVEGRDTLLEGIPSSLVGSFYRSSSNKHIDLAKLIEQLDQLGQLEPDGARPLLIFLENARNTVAGTLRGRILQDLMKELEQEDEEEEISPLAPSASSLPDTPEALIFGGSDERLPYAFFEKAVHVQQSIVRLHIPRIFGTFRDSKHAFGTGWLITPQLVLTNHHVIAARRAKEPLANSADFRAQAEQTIAWFDYIEEETQLAWPCVELVSKNAQLDYTLLRLSPTSDLASRPPLTVAQQQTPFQADRLNIVQHPSGHQLRYAVRNNFYIGLGETSDFIRYLTDTEGGTSGSPVFNDDWLVVAMHRAAAEVL
jgi:hypothetical protein